MLTGIELIQALDWISECQWADLDSDDLTDITDKEINRAIRRHYSGGIAQFRLDYLSVS